MLTDEGSRDNQSKNRYTEFFKSKKDKIDPQSKQFRHIEARSTKYLQHNNKVFHKKRRSQSYENRTYRSVRFHEGEAMKKQFAEEYIRITSGFKNLLLRKPRAFQSQKKGLEINSNISVSASERNLQYFKHRNPTLEKLYTDTSRQQILKVADKKMKSKMNKQIYIYLQQQKQKKINSDFSYIPELLGHFNNIFMIRQLLDDYANNYEQIIGKIKNYMLNYGGADVTKLEELLKVEKQKQRMRILLCLQKIVIIGVLDSLIREKFIEYQIKVTIDSIIGVYYSIFEYIKSDKIGQPYQAKIQEILILLRGLDLQKRKDLKSTIDFVLQKIPIFYRYNQEYFSKLKSIIEEVKQNRLKINRCFYQVLTMYALYLHMNNDILVCNRSLLDSFATCPAPHLPFRRTKGKYTVVFQFQNTLALIKGSSKHKVKFRPYAHRMIEELNKLCEVIIITTLLPESFASLPNIFNEVQAVLYRYHCIRYRGRLHKDVSRLGRKMEQIIMVDSESENITHRENLLVIDIWKGSNLDQELLHAFTLLESLIKENPSDCRQFLRKCKHSSGYQLQKQNNSEDLEQKYKNNMKEQEVQISKQNEEDIQVKDTQIQIRK